MRFMGSQTTNRYDEFKSEIFGKKRDQFKQKYKNQSQIPESKLSSTPPSNHPFFKKVVLLSLVSVGFYYANQKFHLIDQALSYLDSFQVNPINKAVFKSLTSDIARLFSIEPLKHTLKQQQSPYFANKYFCNQLKFHLKNLKQKNSVRYLSQQFTSKVAFGPLKFGCQVDQTIIDKQGNLVRHSQRSRISIGRIGIFGSKTQQIIEYQNTVKMFMNNQPANLENSCKNINLINKIRLKNEQYDKVYKECLNDSKRIYEGIQVRVKQAQKKNYAPNKRSKFLIKIA